MPKAFKNPWVAVALAVGLVQVWANRFYMAYDGVSYLDMGDAYLRGDWHTALNGYWHPLYSWIVAIGLRVLHPSPYWEYPAVHFIDFFDYCIALAGFEFFLRGLMQKIKTDDEVALRILAYPIFLWTSLELIRIWIASPDMLVAASVFTAFGILLRDSNKWTALTLATVLTAGFYAKSVMFPISLMVLIVALIVLPRRKALVASVIFALLAAPLILVLSRTTGHLTIGDDGRLAYSWYIDGVESRFWQGGPARAGYPVHPSRVVLNSPRVYEFGGVFPVTYPIWYDESYWYRGLHVWPAPRVLPRKFLLNAIGVAGLLGLQGGGFLVGWLVCFLLQKDKSIRDKLITTWPVWTVCLGTLFLYCAVHTEPRHLGAFAAALFLVLFTTARIPGRRLAGSIALFGLVWAACFARVTTVKGEHLLPWAHTPQNIPWEVDTGLHRFGLNPGDKVAAVCFGGPNDVVWARLARVHIVAEFSWYTDFWQLSAADQQRVLAALASSGAKMAVSSTPPPDPGRVSGWKQIGSTSFYFYLFANHDRSLAWAGTANP